MQRAQSTTSSDGNAAGQDGSRSPGRFLGARAKTASRPGTRSAPSSPQSTGGTTTPQQSQQSSQRTGLPGAKSTSVSAMANSPSSQSGNMRQPHDIQLYRERLLEIYKAHNSANVFRVDFLLEKYKGQEDFLYRTVCAKYNRPIDLPARTTISAATSPAASATVASAAASTRGSVSATDPSRAKAVVTTTRAKAVLPKPPAKTLPRPDASASRSATAPVTVTAKANTTGPGGVSGRNGAATNHGVSSAPSAPALAATGPGVSIGKGGVEAMGKVPISSGLTNGVSTGVEASRLLREIDILLLDEDTGFFDNVDGGESSDSGFKSVASSDSVSESSGSDEETAMDLRPAATAPKAQSSKPTVPVATRPASARSSASAAKQSAYVATQATEAKSPSLRTAAASRVVSGGAQKVQTAVRNEPLPKSSTLQATATKNEERPSAQSGKPAVVREAASTSVPASSGTPADAHAPTAPADEESDLDDEDLGAALAANLVNSPPPPPAKVARSAPQESAEGAAPKSSMSARPPSPKAAVKHPPALSSRGGKTTGDAASRKTAPVPSARPKKDGAPPAVAATDSEKAGAPVSTKPKAAWGAPPPLRGRTLNGAKPKAAAGEKKPALEGPPPPIFDQWLAILKMLTGWNDQRSYANEAIREHVCEHLKNEGIENKKAVDRLCDTLVPMMTSLRPVDKLLVKNVKSDILRGAKIVQISILRVVAHELMMERDARTKGGVQKKKDAKTAGPDSKDLGTPYLSKDIYSISKVVNHFKFETGFQNALRNLILTIRSQKPSKAAASAGGVIGGKSAAVGKKRKAAEIPDTTDAAGGLSEEAKVGASEPLKRRKALG